MGSRPTRPCGRSAPGFETAPHRREAIQRVANPAPVLTRAWKIGPWRAWYNPDKDDHDDRGDDEDDGSGKVDAVLPPLCVLLGTEQGEAATGLHGMLAWAGPILGAALSRPWVRALGEGYHWGGEVDSFFRCSGCHAQQSQLRPTRRSLLAPVDNATTTTTASERAGHAQRTGHVMLFVGPAFGGTTAATNRNHHHHHHHRITNISTTCNYVVPRPRSSTSGKTG